MKKLVSILLAVVMMASVCSVSAFADSSHEFQPYEQEFLQYLEENRYYPQSFDYGTYCVEYSHFDSEAEETPSWVIIYAYTTINDAGSYGIFDDYIITSGSGMPYDFGYYFYDLTQDKFYMFHEAWELGLIDMEELKASGKFPISILGDADRDGNLTIMDSTEIQFCLANLKELETDYFFRFAGSEYGGRIEHIADRNCDGSVDIMDATTIQLRLANIYVKPVVNEEMVFSDYSQRLDSMPTNTVPLFFDWEYSEKQIYNPVYKAEKFGNANTVVIIKSNEQYRELFNEDAPIFEDDFFEKKCLIAALVRTHGMNGSASVNSVAKNGDTLYVQAIVYRPSGLLEPISPYWLCMVSVDKKLVSDVYNVVEVCRY